MSMDSDIRDIAKSAGHDNLSDEQVRDIKKALANSFIDSVLDSRKMADGAIDPDIEDEEADDDIVADDDAEDATDDKDEKSKRLQSTKVLAVDQPISSSSAVTGYRPGTSGMGQVG